MVQSDSPVSWGRVAFIAALAGIMLGVGYICFSQSKAPRSAEGASEYTRGAGTPAPPATVSPTTTRFIDSVPDSERPKSQTLLEQLDSAMASRDWGLIETLLAACMARNPQGTAAHLEQAQLGTDREFLLIRIAQLWTEIAPTAALQWAGQREDPNEQESLVGAVYLKWAESSPWQAVAAAETAKSLTVTRGDVMRNLASQWAARDHWAALAWAKKQSSGDLRDKLIQQIAIKQAESIPAQAAELVMKEIAPGAQQNEAILSVLHQWAQHDVYSAKAWVARHPWGGDMATDIQWELEGSERAQ